MSVQPSTTANDACLRCGATLQSMGVEHFRSGGMTGAAKFFLGNLGEVGEEIVPLKMLVCVSCRHVEFRAPAPA